MHGGIGKYLITAASHVILLLFRFLVCLPDILLLRFLKISERLFRITHKSGKVPEFISEACDLIRESPNGSRTLRKMLRDNRKEQFLIVLKGAMKHHLGAGTQFSGRYAPVSRSSIPTSCGVPFNIVFFGCGPELELLKEEYEQRHNCKIMQFEKIDIQEAERILEKAGGVEIASPLPRDLDRFADILPNGTALSIHPSVIDAGEQVIRLRNLLAGRGIGIRICYPLYTYPPAQLVKHLILQDEIGEVATIRVRATICGPGSAIAAKPPSKERYLNHPAFDHTMLLAFFGGGIERVAAYLNPMSPEKGGQGLVNFKFAHPGRYGLLECSFAPGLYVKSEFLPYDLEVEIAGSDGIIWMNGGMAERTQTPPVFVRTGRTSYSIGIESGLDVSWRPVFYGLAGQLVGMMERVNDGALPGNDILSAFDSRDAAYRAASEGRVIDVS